MNHIQNVFTDCITPFEWSSICQLVGDYEQRPTSDTRATTDWMKSSNKQSVKEKSRKKENFIVGKGGCGERKMSGIENENELFCTREKEYCHPQYWTEYAFFYHVISF